MKKRKPKIIKQKVVKLEREAQKIIDLSVCAGILWQDEEEKKK